MLNESLPNFEVMATTIKNQARWRCQHCHRPCRRPGETNMAFFLRIEEQFPEWEDELWEEWIDEEFGVVSIPKPGRFILTVVRLGSTSNHSGDGPTAICNVCFSRSSLTKKAQKKGLQGASLDVDQRQE